MNETKTITQNYNFKAGKWYEFKSMVFLDTDLLSGSRQVSMQEGTLDTGKPKGETEEVLTFELK